eukprot:Gb_19588 [translate_table: standard]
MAERLQVGVYDKDNLEPGCHPLTLAPNNAPMTLLSDANPAVNKDAGRPKDFNDKSDFNVPAPSATHSDANGDLSLHPFNDNAAPINQGSLQPRGISSLEERELENPQGFGNSLNPVTTTVENGHEVKREWVEQDGPGVYITLMSLPDGTKDLKRVRFSRKRFSEAQAEVWWAENRARVFEQYNVQGIDKAIAGGSVQSKSRNVDGITQFKLN